MGFQIIHVFPARSVTTLDFHGNTSHASVRGTFCLCGALFPHTRMTKLPKQPTESSQHKHFTISIPLSWPCICMFPSAWERSYHRDIHYCLFPIQELILNLAAVSILIPPPHTCTFLEMLTKPLTHLYERKDGD